MLTTSSTHYIHSAYASNGRSEVAAANCVAQLGPIAPTCLLAFCGGKHPPDPLIDGLRDAFPNVPVIGGAAAGVISREGLGFSGLQMGVLALCDPKITPTVLVSEALSDPEHRAGLQLGRRIRDIACDDAFVLLFYDSVATVNPLRLHYATSLIDGIMEGLDGKSVRLVGGGTLTDLNFGGAWVYDGNTFRQHVAVALVFPPAVAGQTEILHGCRPASTYMQVTKAEGPVIYEIDDTPAFEVISRMVPRVAANLTLATLGANQGDRYVSFDENAYSNRLILSADPATGAVTLFETDFTVGSFVQIMSRDNDLMLASAERGTAAVNAAALAHEALFSLYIDCAGRTSAISGSTKEEADVVRSNLSPSIPFLGFYSGVEIAPFGSRPRALDWTGVLATAFRRD